MTRDWIILAGATGLTGDQLGPLLDRYGDAEGIVRAGAAKTDAAHVDTALAWLAADARHALIAWDDPRYPALLKRTQTAPVALFVRGDTECLSLPQLGIVGSRKATAGGVDNAAAFARHLAARGLVITSGLALGVDTAAHRGALDGEGRTIAVLGTGPDRVYPAANTALAERIIAGGGALVSEFLPGVPPLKDHFPRRNRIISGLALGTLVVEAGIQSGALITARRAIEQGREVFAIPGSIHNPLAKGCHRLIREGAKLVDSAEHILEELGPLLSAQHKENAGEARVDLARNFLPDETGLRAPHPHSPSFRSTEDRDEDYDKLLDALGWDPVTADTLVLRSQLTPAEVSSMLLILELEGTVTPLAGGRYQRTR
jgi:DNA processing protein